MKCERRTLNNYKVFHIQYEYICMRVSFLSIGLPHFTLLNILNSYYILISNLYYILDNDNYSNDIKFDDDALRRGHSL